MLIWIIRFPEDAKVNSSSIGSYVRLPLQMRFEESCFVLMNYIS